MESIMFNMDEVVSRKDYLNNKQKNKKNKNSNNSNKKPPYIIILCLVILSIYVGFQFNTYKKKYRLINRVPDEIASLKDYDIYYTTETYTYDTEIVLNHTRSNNFNKEVISSAIGITNITGRSDYVYGIKDDKLVRIKNNRNELNKDIDIFDDLEVLIENGVKAYAIYNNEIYAFLKGKDIATGIYTKSNENGKFIKVIDGDALQILVDDNNIFVVLSGEDKNIYSYSKDGKNKKEITKNRDVKYMIEKSNVIYFTDEKNGGKIYSVDKYSGLEKVITKEGAVKIENNKNYSNGKFCMGIYDEYIYYINTNKNSKLFKSRIDGSYDEKEVIGAAIEKISMVGHSVIYKEKDGKAIYRYELENGINSEVISGRIVDFSASAESK